jgi:hypothetical protein
MPACSARNMPRGLTASCTTSNVVITSYRPPKASEASAWWMMWSYSPAVRMFFTATVNVRAIDFEADQARLRKHLRAILELFSAHEDRVDALIHAVALVLEG